MLRYGLQILLRQGFGDVPAMSEAHIDVVSRNQVHPLLLATWVNTIGFGDHSNRTFMEWIVLVHFIPNWLVLIVSFSSEHCENDGGSVRKIRLIKIFHNIMSILTTCLICNHSWQVNEREIWKIRRRGRDGDDTRGEVNWSHFHYGVLCSLDCYFHLHHQRFGVTNFIGEYLADVVHSVLRFCPFLFHYILFAPFHSHLR
mmetsp:Transcript_810/g.2760  ORF Transcript_810/g.2760 Transcript_810/m.2760 type:complete len:200 (+) Transcript_810:1539-2138(+)